MEEHWRVCRRHGHRRSSLICFRIFNDDSLGIHIPTHLPSSFHRHSRSSQSPFPPSQLLLVPPSPAPRQHNHFYSSKDRPFETPTASHLSTTVNVALVGVYLSGRNKPPRLAQEEKCIIDRQHRIGEHRTRRTTRGCVFFFEVGKVARLCLKGRGRDGGLVGGKHKGLFDGTNR